MHHTLGGDALWKHVYTCLSGFKEFIQHDKLATT